MSKDNILELTFSDHLNYNALKNFLDDVIVKSKRLGHKRDYRDRISKAQRVSKLTQQNYSCYHCGEEFEFDIESRNYVGVTTEHIIPYRYGSRANEHNAVLAHGHCNEQTSYNDVREVIEAHYGPFDDSEIV